MVWHTHWEKHIPLCPQAPLSPRTEQLNNLFVSFFSFTPLFSSGLQEEQDLGEDLQESPWQKTTEVNVAFGDKDFVRSESCSLKNYIRQAEDGKDFFFSALFADKEVRFQEEWLTYPKSHRKSAEDMKINAEKHFSALIIKPFFSLKCQKH